MKHDPEEAPLKMILYPLETILEPMDFSGVFPKSQPVELELGSGDGSFLVQYATLHPEINFIGIERLLGRLRKIERKARRAGIENVRAIRIESSYFTRYLLRPGSVRAIHIYFPDPWPKRRHRHNRIVNEAFTSIAHRILADDGTVFLRTDDADYFQQMQEVFTADSRFRMVETSGELTAVLTDFERDFNARGVPTLRTAFAKVA